MNLKRMMFWKSSTAPQVAIDTNQTDQAFSEASPPIETADNVITLPTSTEIDPPVSESQAEQLAAKPTARPQRGLLDAPELKAFFESGHFGHGRYDGTNCRTQESMENGRRTIIAEFQNTVTALLGQRIVKAHRLEDAQLETDGVCSLTTARLKLAQVFQEREIAKLHEQIELAEQGRGWVLEAINRYQQGFRLGLKSAIEFDLLTQ